MFIENKYNKWYNSLVKRCQMRGLDKKCVDFYTEKHHIIPRSLGGDNSKSNLVLLTAREHYLAHWLLTKFTIDDSKFKMVCGFYRMTNQKTSTQQRNYTSRQYEVARKMHSRSKSEAYKGRKTGPRFLSENTLQKMRYNGRRTAEINKNKSKEEELKRRNKISESLKRKQPSENSLKNLVRGSGFNTSEGRAKANETRKRSQGKKVIVNCSVCFLTLKDAAIYFNLTIDAAYYRVKTSKFDWCEI